MAVPSFHAITKVPSVLRVKAVFMMGIDESIKEAQNHIEGFARTLG